MIHLNLSKIHKIWYDVFVIFRRWFTIKNISINYGDIIREARKRSGLTQKELAKKTGLAEITIRQYESNKRKPKIENFVKIITNLNLNTDDLTGDFQGVRYALEPIKKRNDFINIKKESYESMNENSRNFVDMAIESYNEEIEKLPSIINEENEWFMEIKKIYSHLDHFEKHMFKYIANDFSFLNMDGQTALNEQMELLLKIPEYRNDNNSDD